MTTIQDVIGDYTPLSNNVVRTLKLVKGALACKIFFTSNLNDRVCRMGLTRLASDLGIDSSTASKNIKWLIDNDYVELIKEHTATSPAHYRCTQKFYDIAKGIDKVNTPVDLINTPIDKVNTPIDLINQEEESEEELKEEKNPPRDFLTDVQRHAQNGVSESTAANPDDQWLEYGKRFEDVYHKLTGKTLSPADRDDIAELSGAPDASPVIWEKSIRESIRNWTGNGIPNLLRIIEVYHCGGDYENFKRWKWPEEEGEVRKPPPDMTPEKIARMRELNRQSELEQRSQ